MTDDLRARATSIRKCVPLADTPSKRRAKAIYEECRDRLGGNLAVTRLEGCDESTVRQRIEHPKKHPPLHAIYSLTPELIRRVAEDLLDAADEMEVRRVG